MRKTEHLQRRDDVKGSRSVLPTARTEVLNAMDAAPISRYARNSNAAVAGGRRWYLEFTSSTFASFVELILPLPPSFLFSSLPFDPVL